MKKRIVTLFVLLFSALIFTACSEEPAHVHSFGEWEIATAATCTEDGSLVRECACSAKEYEKIPAEHDIVSVEAKDATCTDDGNKPYEYCKNCDYTTYEVIPAGHDIVSVEAKDATCTEDGNKAYEYCKNCDYTTYEKIPAAHDIVTVEAKDATCTEDGYKAYEYCKNCDYTTYEKIAAGHSYKTTVLAPTCVEEGYTIHTCAGCGDSYTTDTEAPTGHTMGNQYISAEVSETSDGEKRKNCLNCGHYETEPMKLITSGNFGAGSSPTDAVIYKLFEDGTLKIVGTGATYNCGWNGSKQPFIDYRKDVKKLIICEGITETSGGDFAYLTELLEVQFPKSLKRLNTNAFMDSFHTSITTLTIPASVEFIGTCVFGSFDSSYPSAIFTDIIIENPSLEFYSQNAANIPRIFNYGRNLSSLTLYSVGASNTVSEYAKAVGTKYIDLESRVSGTVGDLSYDFFEGELKLSAKNTGTATLPESSPWLTYIKKEAITSLIIGDGISEIPDGYFSDYTSLSGITLPDSLKKIGSGAFDTSASCDTPLTLTIPRTVENLGENIFKNRTGVTLRAFFGSAAGEIDEENITLKLIKSYRLLLIGNSLSMDAADCSGAGTRSKLYDIIKEMLGEDSFVEIGILYSGARTCTWHATMANEGVSAYQFLVISDDTNGYWTTVRQSATSDYGLNYSDWDAVTIQPYGNETLTGVDDTTTGISGSHKDNDSFGTLAQSLPFLLDYIGERAENAKVYYYLTWASTQSASLNVGRAKYDGTMVATAIAAAAHKSPTGRGFEGIIAVGTAIQNARATYLSLLSYTDSRDAQANLQRDNVHLSLTVGRYIGALMFAETLIPDKMREKDYTLPNISDSAAVGKLPLEYTEIAQRAVENALISAAATDSTRYKSIPVEGYEQCPLDAIIASVKAIDLKGMSASTTAILIADIKANILPILPSGSAVTVDLGSFTVGDTLKSFTATVTIRYGYFEETLTLRGTAKRA